MKIFVECFAFTPVWNYLSFHKWIIKRALLPRILISEGPILIKRVWTDINPSSVHVCSKHMDVDSQIFKAWSYYLLLQAVSGAMSNIDIGGGATGATFNTKKEIEAIYYVPSWLSRCCLDCVFIDSMKIIYQTYVMKSKPYSFHLHFPQILRSFNKLPGGGSSSLYLIMARLLSGTRARSLMEPVTRWLQLHRVLTHKIFSSDYFFLKSLLWIFWADPDLGIRDMRPRTRAHC